MISDLPTGGMRLSSSLSMGENLPFKKMYSENKDDRKSCPVLEQQERKNFYDQKNENSSE